MKNTLPSLLDEDKQDPSIQDYLKQAREIKEAARARTAILFPDPPRGSVKWVTLYDNS